MHFASFVTLSRPSKAMIIAISQNGAHCAAIAFREKYVKRLASLVVFVVCAACTKPGDQILTFAGLGPVKIGMTVVQAEKALDAKMRAFDPSDRTAAQACWYTRRTDGIDQQIAYMVWNTAIVRIDIQNHAPGQTEVSVPVVATEEGIRIGSSEDDVKKQYGSRLVIAPHRYGGQDDHTLTVFGPTFAGTGQRNGILFETWDGKVSTFRAGTPEAIALVEGCS